MKRLSITILLFFCFQMLFAPTQKAASRADVWTPGLYIGWVYFLERSDYDYNLSEGDVSATDTTTLYQESHGDIECSVADEAGNGTCKGSFPMEKIATRNGTFTSKDCTANWTESIRSLGVTVLEPLSPLSNSSLDAGFSIPFTPQSGTAFFNITVNANGGPTCSSAERSGQTTIGIPKWPDLEFHIAYHTPLTLGGTCNMQTFPRTLSINHAVTKAVIEQCQWKLFYYDPYAKLP